MDTIKTVTVLFSFSFVFTQHVKKIKRINVYFTKTLRIILIYL